MFKYQLKKGKKLVDTFSKYCEYQCSSMSKWENMETCSHSTHVSVPDLEAGNLHPEIIVGVLPQGGVRLQQLGHGRGIQLSRVGVDFQDDS